MEKKQFYVKVRGFCKPFRLAHYRLRHISKKTSDAVITAASFITAGVAFLRCFPFAGVGDILLTAIGVVLLAFACTFIYAFLFPAGAFVVSLLFLLPAAVYNVCDDKINHVSRQKKSGGKTKMKARPKAEVGIRYFIEREKGLQINHAQFLE